MTHRSLLFGTVLVAWLCAPALADSPPRTAARSNFRIDLSVVTTGNPRVHELAIAEGGCASVADKTATYDDDLTVCLQPAANGIAVSISGQTVTLPAANAPGSTYRARGEVVVARAGGKMQVGRQNGPRFVAQITPL